jgi:acyl-CoA hydrolase
MKSHTTPRGVTGGSGLFFDRFSFPSALGQPVSANSSNTVTMIEMVFPDQTNHYGTLFGGHALRLMDKAAFVAASRYSRRTVVTACSERVDFKNAVHHGNLIELTAKVVATGRSSMTVDVALFAEDLLSGKRTLCAQGKFVLVALDESGKPVAVPSVSTEAVRTI